jgi:hypothetical protein
MLLLIEQYMLRIVGYWFALYFSNLSGYLRALLAEPRVECGEWMFGYVTI